MDKQNQKGKEQAIRQLEELGFIVKPGYPGTKIPFTGLVGKRRKPLHVNPEQANNQKK
ncbi:hypothetical protein [Paenibacillus sp. Y412MC10]|uniref:hypothetical protein n=1 Tax=Geobacillus sp. (strain Y412MC10) TaxID=481743 RepID=UPI001642D6B9|nr:hypothetical protein [Paenibacillus sp. Y412MC10]